MKRTLYILGLAFVVSIAAQAQKTLSTDKAISDGHCQILVPNDWTDLKAVGAGARSTKDVGFTATVRGIPSSEYQTDVDTMKQRKGSVVDENESRILLVEPRGAKRRYVELTKAGPNACRATVTFSIEKVAVARKIVETLKPMK